MTALRVALAAILTTVLGSGCQRGCLTSWLGPKLDAGPAFVGPTPPHEPACPGGIARCLGGVVAVSRELDPPHDCPPEGCRCPWDDVAPCACAAEGLTIEMPAVVARVQLCAAPSVASFTSTSVVHPPDAGADVDDDIEVGCEIERYRCRRGVVVACDGGERPLATCLRGCAEGEGRIEADVAPDVALAILCKR